MAISSEYCAFLLNVVQSAEPFAILFFYEKSFLEPDFLSAIRNVAHPQGPA